MFAQTKGKKTITKMNVKCVAIAASATIVAVVVVHTPNFDVVLCCLFSVHVSVRFLENKPHSLATTMPRAISLSD